MIMNRCHDACKWWLLSLVLAFPCAAAATDFFEGSRISGFGTFGLLRGGDDDIGYRRDISMDGVFDNDWTSKQDTLIGLQLDLPLAEGLDAAVQLVAKDRPASTFRESLEWAYIRYRPTPELMLRGGRLGLDLFMLSEYRYLGFSYLWVRPPAEFYGTVYCNNYDGADVTYKSSLGDGAIWARMAAGRNSTTLATPFSENESSEVVTEPLISASIGVEFDDWQSRFSVARLRQAASYKSAEPLINALYQVSGMWPEAEQLIDEFNAEGTNTRYYALGATYEPKPWIIQSEIGYISSDYKLFGSVWSAYLSVGYGIGPVTIYGLGGIVQNTDQRRQVDSAPPFLIELQQMVQNAYDQAYADQHSLSLGMRWDIQHNLALKAQWDRTWIDAYGGGLWLQRRSLTESRTMNTFSINLNFLF
jgi:hypothetical protein